MLPLFQIKLAKNVLKQNINGNIINKLQNKNHSKHDFFNRINVTKSGIPVFGFKNFDDYIEYFNVNKQR